MMKDLVVIGGGHAGDLRAIQPEKHEQDSMKGGEKHDRGEF